MPVKRVAATVSSFAALLALLSSLPVPAPARADAAADSVRAASSAESLQPAAPGDSAAARPAMPRDSTRVVRTLPPVLVRALALDVMSSEARRSISAATLHALPVDRVADVLALEPGIVVDDGVVHVRGARPGELRVELDGIALNEPFRGEGFELPVVALDGLDLIRGGREAEHGGGLAGTLVARPATAGDRLRSRLLWETTGGGDTPDDRVGARLAGPILRSGLGLALGGEARLDDASLPDLRTPEHTRVLGVPVAWRARNQATALARIAPVKEPARLAVTALVSRRLLRPWNPMFTVNGWVSPCTDPDCVLGPRFSPTEIDSDQYTRFDAADHYPTTDVRRLATIVSSATQRGPDRFDAALGWNLERRLTSVGGAADPRAITPANAPFFGYPSVATSDPFHLYGGDTPYFRQTRAEWIEARAGWHRDWASGSALGAGLGATHERVSFHEVDDFEAGADSVRTFRASAPGGNAWISGRWVNPGLIATLGLRADWFSPGPEATHTPHDRAPRDHLLLSPRFGLSFPLSARDAVQAAYERVQQAPGREFLYDSRSGRVSPRHPLGNPLLEPSTAVSWEAVLRHRENARWSGTAGFFWRDLAGEVGARQFRLPDGTTVLRYESSDVAHALGLELTVAREDRDRSRIAATYTWMQAQGSESFEDGVPIHPLALPQPPPIT